MNEKQHARAHEIFEETLDEFQKFIETKLNKTVENNPVEDDDDRFEAVIRPMVAAIASSVANYFFYLNYSKGDMLEMLCDFYHQTEMSELEEEEGEETEGCEECEEAEKKVLN